MDVAAWLHRLGLGQYERAFRDNAVDGEILPRLTGEDLKDLGVAAVGHRRRMLDAIAALRAAGAETAAAHPGPAEPAGERRQVTVLFADLAGYTALSGELDAEEVHALLGRFFERVDRLVEEHGGRVDKHIGDCVMAVFGAPLAYGNDAERAVRAALAVRDAMPAVSAEVGRRLRVHIGVAGGQVVASGTGSASRREYTVTGQSVNLASRLAEAARAGEILVSDAVRRALGAAARLRRVGPAARGERLRRAGAGVAAARPAARARPAAGRSWDGPPSWTVSAPPSPTAARAAAGGPSMSAARPGSARRASSRSSRRRRAGPGSPATPGWSSISGPRPSGARYRSLVLGMLGLEATPGAAGEAILPEGSPGSGDDPAPAEEAVFLNDLLGLPQPAELRALYDAMDNAARAEGRRRILTSLVERSSRARPRLFVVEDLHWADRPTLAHLASLCAAVSRCPAILVATSRVEGDPLRPAWWAEASEDEPLFLHLGPLDAAEARVLAGAFLAANASLAERCVERAAGNPLFLEQLLRNAEEGRGTAVPGSVQSLVQARLDRLDPDDRVALQAASVLGQRFDLETLRHILGQPDRNVERIAELSLVRPQGERSFLFAHALVRDAVYDSMLRSRRRELHRRAAEWCEGRDAALRAEHLDRADDPGAARAYLAAAEAQSADYRYERALRSAERGLELAGDGADRFALRCLRADILHDLGQMPAALSAYEAALAAASGDAERCRALIGLAAVKRVTDDLDGAFADLERAEAAALRRGGSPPRRPASTSSAAICASRAATSRAACERTAGAWSWPARPARPSRRRRRSAASGTPNTCAVAWSARTTPSAAASSWPTGAASDASRSPTGR